MTDAVDTLPPGDSRVFRQGEGYPSELSQILRVSSEIAVVAMSCRTPGGIVCPEGLWQLLSEGKEALSPFPERYPQTGLYQPGARSPGKSYVNRGGFLENVEFFDPSFFGVSPREAKAMDPQQRLALELAWEAFERAGLPAKAFRGSKTAIYMGTSGSDYGQGRPKLPGFTFTGQAVSVLAGRLSYLLGLHGAAVAVDTACSSSLVAIHLACNALRQGECDMALAGGVQLMCDPERFVDFSQMGVLSPKGRCRPFSDQADGAVWGEGAGLVLLQPLSAALAQNNPVLAVIPGSAINQDGPSYRMTAPSSEAQEALLREALKQAELSPHEIDALEAHGTGTPLGDPTELKAIASVFASDKERESPLHLSSLKANIGHAQAAAGVLGLVKMVLALQQEQLPKMPFSGAPCSGTDWSSSGLSLLIREQPWPRCPQGRQRRAGVSSFGISGTNAHVIVQEAPPSKKAPCSGERTVLPLLLSAKSEKALQARAHRLSQRLQNSPSKPSLEDLSYSLACTRTPFSHRISFLASQEDAHQGFPKLLEQLQEPFHPTAQEGGKLAMMFSGQGSQWEGMGAGLYHQAGFEVFRSSLDQALKACQEHLSEELRDVMWPEHPDGKLHQTRYIQPALFSLETALYRQWEAWGVRAQVLIGHSLGELSAAHIAGVLNLKEAARLVCARARLMEELAKPDGAMVSLALCCSKTQELLQGKASLEIAAINSPSQTVVSGSREAVEKWVTELSAAEIPHKPLKVPMAFHSAHMEPVLEAFAEVAQSVDYQAPQLPVLSNVSGRLAQSENGELTSARYWVEQLRSCVRFQEQLEGCQELGVSTFLEVGPKPVLSPLAINYGKAVPSLRPGRDPQSTMLGALGELHCRRHSVDWEKFFEGSGATRMELPVYPFQRKPYWLEPLTESSSSKAEGFQTLQHPFLSSKVELPDGSWLYIGTIQAQGQHSWLREHVVQEEIVLPGSATLELCCWLTREMGCAQVAHLDLIAPVRLAEKRALQCHLVPTQDGYQLQIRSKTAGDSWRLHATAHLDKASASPTSQAPARPTSLKHLDLSSKPEQAISYGKAFQGLDSVRVSEPEKLSLWATVRATLVEEEDFLLHPTSLDSVFQALVYSGACRPQASQAYVPVQFAGVKLHRAQRGDLHAQLDIFQVEETSFQAKISVFNSSEEAVLSIDALTLSRVHLSGASNLANLELHTIQAQAVESLSTAPTHQHSLLDLRSHGMSAQELCSSVMSSVQQKLEEERTDSILLLTQNAVGDQVEDIPGAAVWGLMRSLRVERRDLKIFLLDCEDHTDSTALAEKLRGCDGGDYSIRGGQLYRLEPTPLPPSPLPSASCYSLKKAPSGRLDELSFTPDECPPLAPHQIRLQIKATGLNFRDVLNAMGLYPGEAGPLGNEASGIVLECGSEVRAFKVGEAVMGLVQSSLGPQGVADHRLLTPIPQGLNWAQAATIPVVFLTAWYSLVRIGQIEAKERVLIHSLAGGVGLAALQIARHKGAQILGTASLAKWSWLQQVEGLSPSQLGNSRDLSFLPKFEAFTEGQGVDLVLNALKGEFLDASLSLMPRGGRFIELGKTDLREADQIASSHKGVVYRALDLNEVEPCVIQQMFQELSPLFAKGVLRPLPLRAFDLSRSRAAFQWMAQARHRGKVVLVPPASGLDKGPVLITGGTGGLGLLLAQHLVKKYKVRELVLLHRTPKELLEYPPLDEESKVETLSPVQVQRKLSDLGAKSVQILECDVSNSSSLTSCLKLIEPRTIFHLAGRLQDAVFEKHDQQSLEIALTAKLGGALNIERYLSTHHSVEQVIFFSSIVGQRGGRGQANYAAANAGLDALAQRLRSQGHHALSIAWGPWARVGMAARLSSAQQERLRRQGLDFVSAQQGMRLLDEALCSAQAYVMAAPERGNLQAARGKKSPRKKGFEQLGSLPKVERSAYILALVRDEASRVLGLPNGPAVPKRGSWRDLGLDSLMSVELRNRLQTFVGRKLPSDLTTRYQTALDIATHIEEELFSSREPESPSSQGSCLTALRNSGSRTPLFLVPPAGGTAEVFRRLSNYLDPEQPVFSFNPCWTEHMEPAHNRVEEMAQAYLDELLQICPSGPYKLGGMCFGAHVAYEMAQRLLASGRPVSLLAVIDSTRPASGPSWTAAKPKRNLKYFAQRFLEHSRQGSLVETLLNRARKQGQKMGLSATAQERYQSLLDASHRAYIQYTAKPFPAPLTVFLSEEFATESSSYKSWLELGESGSQKCVIPGTTHLELIMDESKIQQLSERLSPWLR